jgi:regulator of protease activity HflC (stomatin/prohibitin superfamily)
MDISRLIAGTLAWIVLLGVPLGVLFYVGRMIWFSFFERAVVYEFQLGLKYKDGRFVGIVKPGAHWKRRNVGTIVAIDTREQLVVLDALELVPRDNVPTSVNAVANYRVVDPVAAFTSVVDYEHAVRNMVQVGLRKAAFAMTSKELIQQSHELATAVIESTVERQRELGVSLTSLDITA